MTSPGAHRATVRHASNAGRISQASTAGIAPRAHSLTVVTRQAGAGMFGKVRVMVMDAPRHVVIFENGKRFRLFPVVVGSKS